MKLYSSSLHAHRYGPSGPYKAAKCYDQAIQPMSGVGDMLGALGQEGPTLMPGYLVDKVTALNAAYV